MSRLHRKLEIKEAYLSMVLSKLKKFIYISMPRLQIYSKCTYKMKISNTTFGIDNMRITVSEF